MAGCSGDGPETTAVQGKITIEGRPVTHGLINFLAEGGRPVGGGIQPDGTYSFDIPPGQYRVRIDAGPLIPESWKEGEPMPNLGPRLVPEKFASYEMSGLAASVGSESPQQLDFKLP